ncbi:MAG TPA: ATP-binding protein, partial [Pyrinomonadaceae bacterium]
DVTERRRAEEERDRFFDLSGDLLCIADFNGYFKRLNPAWSKTLGYDDAELLSKPFSEFIHPDDRESTAAMVEHLAAGGGATNFENRYACKDGSYRWLSWSATPVVGRRTIYGVARDVTESRQAAEALRQADLRAIKEYQHLVGRIAVLAQSLGSAHDLLTVYRALRDFAIASGPCDGIAVTLYDAERQTRTFSYGWTDGVELSLDGLKPIPVGDGYAGETLKTQEVFIRHDYKKSLEGRYTYFVDPKENGRVADSALFAPMAVMGSAIGLVELQSYESNAYAEEHATAMRMAANLAANAIENVRLAQKEREKAEQLRQSQKMEAVGRLAGGVAHDFNNLLTAIMGYSDLSLRKLEEHDPLRHSFEEIRKAADRAASLTRHLLAFSRKQVLQPKVMSLNTTVSEVDQMLRRLIGEDVEVVCVLAPDLGLIKADQSQVEQVLMNLVVNARDAMPGGGKLTVETANVYLDEEYAARHVAARPGYYVQLVVSDTGTGMSEETQARIFEPFFTTKEMGKGTGLGLSTVYGIVKQSAGSVWVYSELGTGTTFKVYLPRVDEEAEEVRAKSRPAELPRGDETILLVEDDEMVRTMTRGILEMSGYRVQEAKLGEEALRLFAERGASVDLLLTDVVMPQMSGKQLRDCLSAVRPDLPVLFMSGYTDEAVVHHGVLSQGAAFLQKPFTPAGLLQKVREVLDEREKVCEVKP